MRNMITTTSEHRSARAEMAASHSLCANFAFEKGTDFVVSFFFIFAFLFQGGLPTIVKS